MWTKQPKTKFASSFFSVLKYSNLNSKNSKINQKKYLSSSIDKSIPTVTKLTKSMLNNKKTKNKQDPHTENNTIDINISVNYHKNANLLRNNHEHILSSLYKAPMKKITSYSMNPSAHKRNSSDASDSNIIQNNLNISLTNIASPKNNNSFIVNPIFFNKTIDEAKEIIDKWGNYKTGIVIVSPVQLTSNFLKIERIFNYHLLNTHIHILYLQ